MAELLASARALVVCATEEFGIAAVEALAAGRPVIALGEGGVRESVREGETGAFFSPCEPEALAATVVGFDPATIDPQACRAAAERFGTERFVGELRAIVAAAVRAERAPAARRTAGAAGPCRGPARAAAGGRAAVGAPAGFLKVAQARNLTRFRGFTFLGGVARCVHRIAAAGRSTLWWDRLAKAVGSPAW